ncbi:MAG: hypothetical protein JXB29_00505 [Sedimentisphaerales bacterium]|nr:hypothetical protein [Sedimentisphaerales bacterium]
MAHIKSNCPKWLSTAVFYQIYPQSFYDSNSDGIGDIPGIIEKLDYIKFLGCDAIWLNPCFESPFGDAGYDVSDYYRVAKRYGTNADLKRLFREADKRNIKICLDLVVAHTSIEHPWFKQSCKAEKNKYSNWYIWNDGTYKPVDKDLRFGWIRGYCNRDANFALNYYWCQPALNYGFAQPDSKKPWQLRVDHPDVKAVRKEVMNIMSFWLDMGASGFRVDMARSLVKHDPGYKATSQFWRQVRQMLDKDYPNAVLISEWSCPTQAISAGFHVDFMIQINEKVYNYLFRMEKHRDVLGESTDEGYSFFDKQGKGDIQKFLDRCTEHLRNTKGKGYISIPTGNHDTGRIGIGRNQKELEMVFAFIMTMPGVPFIYYGDEIGMRYVRNWVSKEGGYARNGSRTPMQWNDSKNAGFSKAPALKLYLPADSAKNRPNVEKQTANQNSLLNRVRQLIRLRKNSPALCADGSFTALYAKSKKYPLVYMRSDGNQRYIAAFNPSKYKVRADFTSPVGKTIPELKAGWGTDLKIQGRKCKIDMNAVSYGIFKL